MKYYIAKRGDRWMVQRGEAVMWCHTHEQAINWVKLCQGFEEFSRKVEERGRQRVAEALNPGEDSLANEEV